jgi:HlyD family secretion protein
MRKTILIIVVIAVLAGGGYFIYRNQVTNAQAQTTYQTVKLAMGDLTATVGATGTVRSNQTTTVNWQIQGRVGTINVKVGDKVQSNQVLAVLDTTSLPQNIILARSDLVTAQRNLDNLKNSTTARAQAQQTLADAKKALSDAQVDRYQENLGRVSKATLDQTQAQLVIDTDSLKRAQDNYNNFSSRPADDVMRAQAFDKLAKAQAAVDTDHINLAWMTGTQTDVILAQKDAAIKLAQSKLDDAQREWDRLKNGPDPQDIVAAQAKVDSINATLALTQLVSPINGTVTAVSSMVGDQVSAGKVSFRIEDQSRLLVDVPVAEVDINRVKNEQPASLTFDAISSKTYNGKVTDVASVGTSQNGVVNYTVTVELTNADTAVRAGMTAAVNLTVEQLTNVLLVPNRAVRLQNGKRIVYLLDNGQPRVVEVTLGSSADTMTQIIRGEVKAGDEVILNPPTGILSPGAGSGIQMRGAFGGG